MTHAPLPHRIAGVVAALVCALTTVAVLAPAAPADAAPTSGLIDPRIDQASCALLGRVWSSGTEVDPPHRRSVGCRVDACLDAAAKIRPVTGQEVCYFGDQLNGPRYGAYVDSRVCAGLDRRWIPQVNMCASNPFRSRALFGRARQCTGQATVYVTLRETEGYFDECLTQRRYQQLRDVADRSGRSLRAVVIAMSQVNCVLRPNRAYRSDRCVQRSGSRPRTDRVLITGESVMWRGHDELEQLRPEWSVDALPGRQLGDLPARIRHEWQTKGRPASVIIGLGTNPTPGYEKEDLEAALAPLGDKTHVMFVFPYRGSGTKNQAANVARYVQWERELAKQSPGNRCAADFPAFVKSHPDVLGADGIHPAPAKERAYARYLTRSWDSCLEQFSARAQQRWMAMGEMGSVAVSSVPVLWSVRSTTMSEVGDTTGQ